MKTIRPDMIPALQRLLDDAVAAGEEIALQLAIYQDGELKADLCAGSAEQDSLIPVFSCGKGLMATVIHRLVERGVLSYDLRVADVWPEFGCAGKEDIRLWHLLTHRSGIFELPAGITDEELADWDGMCRKIAAMAPAWKPGGPHRYQSITHAWLLGETAHRADGRDFGRILSEEVLEPLGIQRNFFFGLPERAENRYLPIEWGGNPPALNMDNPTIRRASIPSANGIGCARALARHYAALIGEVDGVRLLKPETMENATLLRRSADDPILPGQWSKFGLGYALPDWDGAYSPTFGHGGAAGSEGFADKADRIALALVKNKALTTHPGHPIRDRISQLLGYPIRHW